MCETVSEHGCLHVGGFRSGRVRMWSCESVVVRVLVRLKNHFCLRFFYDCDFVQKKLKWREKI